MSAATKKLMEAPTPRPLFWGKGTLRWSGRKRSVLPLLFQKPNPGTKPGSVNELVLSPCVTKDPALLSKPGYWPDCQNQRNEETGGKGNVGGGTQIAAGYLSCLLCQAHERARRLHQNDSLDPVLQEGGTKLSLLRKSGFPGLTAYSEGSTWL